MESIVNGLPELSLKRQVVVIGAGVVGLTTALELVERGYHVNIVARHLPGDIDIDYTSPFAGANWSSFAETEEVQEWDRLGYEKLKELAKDPGASIMVRRSRNYNRKAREQLKDIVTGYREIPEEELIPGTHCGFEYDSIVISVPIYLGYLMQRLLGKGVVIRRAHLKHIKDAHRYSTEKAPCDVIVNCSGLFASKLGGIEDKSVYPIKGQILLVRNNCPTLISVAGIEGPDEESFYIFPRKEGGCIIGGTYEFDDWSPDTSEGFIERTKERVANYAPEMLEEGPLDIYKVAVGLRPGRDQGPRIEREEVAGVGKVVHNYGCGGTGYQNSHGMAIKAANLVDSFFSA